MDSRIRKNNSNNNNNNKNFFYLQVATYSSRLRFKANLSREKLVNNINNNNIHKNYNNINNSNNNVGKNNNKVNNNIDADNNVYKNNKDNNNNNSNNKNNNYNNNNKITNNKIIIIILVKIIIITTTIIVIIIIIIIITRTVIIIIIYRTQAEQNNNNNNKRPDGLTLVPWREGRCLVWDVTVADTTAASYLTATSTLAGSAAESASVRKEAKYAELSNRFHFFPIAIESHGPISIKATSFLSDLGQRITMSTSDARETSFLFQRISVTLQRLNAVCVSDSFRDLLVNDSG